MHHFDQIIGGKTDIEVSMDRHIIASYIQCTRSGPDLGGSNPLPPFIAQTCMAKKIWIAIHYSETVSDCLCEYLPREDFSL